MQVIGRPPLDRSELGRASRGCSPAGKRPRAEYNFRWCDRRRTTWKKRLLNAERNGKNRHDNRRRGWAPTPTRNGLFSVFPKSEHSICETRYSMNKILYVCTYSFCFKFSEWNLHFFLVFRWFTTDILRYRYRSMGGERLTYERSFSRSKYLPIGPRGIRKMPLNFDMVNKRAQTPVLNLLLLSIKGDC